MWTAKGQPHPSTFSYPIARLSTLATAAIGTRMVLLEIDSDQNGAIPTAIPQVLNRFCTTSGRDSDQF